MMTQAVIDLNDDLAKIRQSYAEVLASQRRMERERNLSEEAAVEVCVVICLSSFYCFIHGYMFVYSGCRVLDWQ